MANCLLVQVGSSYRTFASCNKRFLRRLMEKFLGVLVCSTMCEDVRTQKVEADKNILRDELGVAHISDKIREESLRLSRTL